ncbi:MAG: efflux RND transporter periplasmic adaptor subunit [Bacteroidales bacterium]
MKNIRLFFFLLPGIIIFSCNKKGDNRLSSEAVKSQKDSTLTLTLEEERNASIQTDTLQHKIFPAKVPAKASIKADPRNIYSVIPPIEGFVKQIYPGIGDYVKKGTPLAKIYHPDYLNLQEKYIKTLAQSELEKDNFSSQGELYLEKAGSLKNMNKSKTQYKQTETSLNSLEQKLDMLNIKKEKVAEGKISPFITLYAPEEGIITEIIPSTGQLSNSANPVCKIMDIRYVQVELDIPANFIFDIENKQKADYSINNKTQEAIITQIHKEINPKTNTFKAMAKPIKKNKNLYPGLTTKAIIDIDSARVLAIDTSALQAHKNNNYIFIKEGQQNYSPATVSILDTCEGYISIKNPDTLKNKNIVTKGSGFLLKKYINQ